TPALAGLTNKWQPTGDWLLTVANPGAAQLERFAVNTAGTFTRKVCAWVPVVNDVVAPVNGIYTVAGSLVAGSPHRYTAPAFPAAVPAPTCVAATATTTGGRDTVYAFRATATRSFRFAVTGAGYNTVVSVRSSCDPARSRVVACNDTAASNNSTTDVALTSGQVVYVVVDTTAPAATGNFTLTVSPI
ncbi:MAG: hypothetical protein ACOYOB_19440, partial [Myxococcota bacterium]